MGGAFQGVLVDHVTWSNPVFFPDGSTYQVFALIDVDESDTLTSGDYVSAATKMVTVSGNMIVDFVYPGDFVINL